MNETLIPPAHMLGSMPLALHSSPLVTISTDELEEGMQIVRRASYDEGYKDGHRLGYADGQKAGFAEAIAVLHVRPQDAIEARGILLDADGIVVKSTDMYHSKVSEHAHKVSTAARGAKKDHYWHHTKARIANKMAAEHHREMAHMVRGLGQTERANTHESLAANHDSHADYHNKERRAHKTRKGIVSRLLRKGIELPPQEDLDALVVKAMDRRMKRKDWISAKIAIIMKDGIRGHAVTQAQAVAVAHKLWQKKRNRRRPPAEAKSVEVMWWATGGIAVNASELQYKDTDGQDDGLNEERRRETDNQPFDPLVVPPIAIWQASDGQVYVVDGHKRLGTAKRRGIPAIRVFFISADSFDEAKKKGEHLNEKMGTKSMELTFEERLCLAVNEESELYVKAKDSKGHEHAPKGSSKGGQFVSTGGGGGVTKGKGGRQDGKKKEDKKPKGQEVNENEPQHILPSDGVTEFGKGAGATYTVKKVATLVREKHAQSLDRKKLPSQTTENEKKAKRVSIKKKGAYITPAAYMILRQKAMTKIMNVGKHPAHLPTDKEKKRAKDGIALRMKRGMTKGPAVNDFRKTLNGNPTDRRLRKAALAVEFGDGKKCGCVYCGVIISFSKDHSSQPMDEDKINDTESGGTYKIPNLLPACIPCNRGDKKQKDSISFLQQSKYGQTHLPSSPDNPKYTPPKEE